MITPTDQTIHREGEATKAIFSRTGINGRPLDEIDRVFRNTQSGASRLEEMLRTIESDKDDQSQES